MQRLFDLAESLDIVVEYHPLRARNGEYRDDLRRIRLREGMSERLTRWTLAHELGHAHHGHCPNMFGQSSARQEREANEWACQFLFTIADYRDVEAHRGGHIPSMAHDLGIVSDGIRAYQGMLERLGDEVYLKPQHGAGQYLTKIYA